MQPFPIKVAGCQFWSGASSGDRGAFKLMSQNEGGSCLGLPDQGAAVLPPQHSAGLRGAAAARPPADDNAPETGHSPQQEPLLCMPQCFFRHV